MAFFPRCGLLLLLLASAAVTARSQSDAPPLKFREGPDGMSAGFVGGEAPKKGNLDSGGGLGIEERQWLKIDTAYTVSAPLEYLPQVRFRVYVDVDSPKGKLSDTSGFVPALLYGETTYVNVPNVNPGHELHVTFFIHPFTMHRYGGGRNFTHFDTDRNIHIDAYVGEDKVASRDLRDVSSDNAKWYLAEGLEKINGLVIPRERSPWASSTDAVYPQAPLKGAGE